MHSTKLSESLHERCGIWRCVHLASEAGLSLPTDIVPLGSCAKREQLQGRMPQLRRSGERSTSCDMRFPILAVKPPLWKLPLRVEYPSVRIANGGSLTDAYFVTWRLALCSEESGEGPTTPLRETQSCRDTGLEFERAPV